MDVWSRASATKHLELEFASDFGTLAAAFPEQRIHDSTVVGLHLLGA